MKGRRFNIVDLLILLLVVFALIYLAGKFLPKQTTGGTASKPLHAVFLSEPTDTWAPLESRLFPGVAVNVNYGGTTYAFGTLASVRVLPDNTSAPNAQGQLVPTTDPAQRLIQITVDISATGGTTGAYTVHGNPIYLGQLTVLEAGPVQLTGSFIKISP